MTKEDIISKELVKYSGKTFSENSQAMAYVLQMLDRCFEAGRQSMADELEEDKKFCFYSTDN